MKIFKLFIGWLISTPLTIIMIIICFSDTYEINNDIFIVKSVEKINNKTFYIEMTSNKILNSSNVNNYKRINKTILSSTKYNVGDTIKFVRYEKK